MTTTRELAGGYGDEIIALRRALHMVPEYDLELPKTQALILAALEGLRSGDHTRQGAVLGHRRTAAAEPGHGPVVLLRGDMDALPVTERVDVPYESTHPGMMHACGHDLHVAGLVGAAKILHAMRDQLAGDVVFMFQPGEETTGGAPIMIREGRAGRPPAGGWMRRTVCTSSRRVSPLGMWSSKAGPLMAAADQLSVRVVGAGAHGSEPFNGKDPIPVACEIVGRAADDGDAAVRRVRPGGDDGRAGSRVGRRRTSSRTTRSSTRPSGRSPAESRAKMQIAAPRLVEGIAAAHGLTAEVEYRVGYPVTVNDEQEYEFARQAIVDLFGADRYRERAHAECGAEDMSYVLQRGPRRLRQPQRLRAPPTPNRPPTTTPRWPTSTTPSSPTPPPSSPNSRYAASPEAVTSGAAAALALTTEPVAPERPALRSSMSTTAPLNWAS